MIKSYKNKLTSFEVQPPQAAWDYIAAELSINRESLAVSNRLFDYEVVPPAEVLSVILSSLQEDSTLTAYSADKKLKKKFLPVMMMVAAMLATIVAGVYYFNGSTVLKNRLMISRISSTNNNKTQPEPPLTAPLPLFREQKPGGNMKPSGGIIAKTNKNYPIDNKVLQNTKVERSLLSGTEFGFMITAKPIRSANGEIIQNTEIINNPGSKYISITGPNGQQTKISSKFLHMLLFINDDSDIDEVDSYFDKNFMESLIWKSRFQDWRNQIINTSFVPSSTNFMDILDFKDLLMKDR